MFTNPRNVKHESITHGKRQENLRTDSHCHRLPAQDSFTHPTPKIPILSIQYLRFRRWCKLLALILCPFIFLSSGMIAAKNSHPQATPPDAESRRTAEPLEGSSAANLFLASQFAQIADVIAQTQITDDHEYQKARLEATDILLRKADDLVPDDSDLYRRLLQFAVQSGEIERERTLRRDILRLNPKDAQNQWRIITDRIAQLNSAEQRINALDRFLDPAATAIDSAVRSRLALQSALLFDEIGDTESFILRLESAVQLDPANIDAIQLQLSNFDSKMMTPRLLQRTSRLLQWMNASPFDPQPTFELARLLRSNGAYASSRLALDNLQILYAHNKTLPPPEVASAVALTRAAEQGPVRGFEFLDDYANRLSQKKQAFLLRAWEEYDKTRNKNRPAEAPSDGRPPIPLDETGSVRARLPVELDVVRLALVTLMPGKDQRRNELLKSIATSYQAEEVSLRKIIKQGDDSSLPLIIEQLQTLLADRLWTRLWLTENHANDDQLFGRSVRQDFNELLAADILRPEAIQRFRAWLELRNGEIQNARARFETLGSTDLRSAVGLALITELTDPPESAARLFSDIWSSSPGSLLGIWAGRKASVLRNRPLPLPATAHLLSRAVNENLNIIRTSLLHPGDAVPIEITVRHTSPELGIFAPTTITTRITNKTTHALTMRPTPNREPFLKLEFFARASRNNFEGPAQPHDTGSSTDDWQLLPQFVRLPIDRISLEPDDSITISFPLDRSEFGILVRNAQLQQLQIAVRASLASENLSENGPPGALGIRIATTIALPAPETLPFPPDRLSFDPAQSTPSEILESLTTLASWLHSNADPGAPAQSSIESAIKELQTAWPDLDDTSRALALLTIPASWKSNHNEKLLSEFEEAASHSLGPLSNVAFLLTRIPSADHPHLVTALSSKDELTKSIAIYIRELGEFQNP